MSRTRKLEYGRSQLITVDDDTQMLVLDFPGREDEHWIPLTDGLECIGHVRLKPAFDNAGTFVIAELRPREGPLLRQEDAEQLAAALRREGNE